ncbi:MAG TPA: transglutaminase-like domain-containing protein [Candidatus Aminicenantes bacterium]|nr:transglutaminase-like domain-containing protein [Candidatus Aminicenantes bacterium]HRY63854.1 transglutaminase-like domain-containing protein [Candidatus Aminicenantes bacterium]HRZ70767.1 transglutaminase-like domain-containing protein [Candidatus Aminicenantes bacterium]
MKPAQLRLAGGVLAALGVVLGGLAFLLGSGSAKGDLTLDLKFKDRVVSGAYKAYGSKDCPVPMWLAKSVFRNQTGLRLTDLRVRYRVSEYAESDWNTWHKYAAVDPGQTVVDLYYPIFTAQTARLTSRAPADLTVECQYTDGRGRKQEFSESRRLTIMSRYEFFFSDLTAEERTGAFQDSDTNYPLMAAWVSRSDDAVVGRLASLANKKAGGLGASESDESCIEVLGQLYEMMRAIHISYQHPPNLQDSSMSYDIKSVQSLQFPRDTIEKRSGTCIDLAILMAAMMNSVNIEPILVSMDGHCFPMARLPQSRRFVPVEATGVGDGYAKSMSFAEAYKSAMETWNKINRTGRYNLIDVRTLWTQGIGNPELDPLPPDILEKWGIMETAERGGGGGGRRPAPDQNRPAPTPARGSLAGNWACQLTMPNGQGVTGGCQIVQQGSQVQLIFRFAYQQMGEDGQMHQVQEMNPFQGSFDGATVQAVCSQSQVAIDGMTVPSQGLPYRIVLQAVSGGLQGQFANSAGITASLALVRQ